MMAAGLVMPEHVTGWHDASVTETDDRARARLLRRGFWLEYVTLGWNVAGIGVLGFAAVAARSVALAGFGLDSLIEIGASTVVIWELSGTGEDRQRLGLRLIGYAFTAWPCTCWFSRLWRSPSATVPGTPPLASPGPR